MIENILNFNYSAEELNYLLFILECIDKKLFINVKEDTEVFKIHRKSKKYNFCYNLYLINSNYKIRLLIKNLELIKAKNMLMENPILEISLIYMNEQNESLFKTLNLEGNIESLNKELIDNIIPHFYKYISDDKN